jgi:hypothetical protein
VFISDVMERITPPDSSILPGLLDAFSDQLPMLALIGLLVLFAVLFLWWLPRQTRVARSRRMFRVVPKTSRPHPDRTARVHTAPLHNAFANMADPAQQLEAVHRSGFERTRLLNNEEARLLPILESATSALGQGHRVMAQTSLGEVIVPTGTGPEDAVWKNAFAAINSKRLDFGVFDKGGYLVCAIEYQGSGHYQGRAFMRDAVKREALRKAGVPLIEAEVGITADHLAAELNAKIAAGQRAV